MQIPIQITVREMEHSPALDENIRSKATKLEQCFSPITSCRVVVEAPQKRRHHGGKFTVKLDITVPEQVIVVNHVQDEDVYVALRDAFDAAKRQLEDYARARRERGRAPAT
jgi:ribosomal subunit interface protein